MKILSGVLGTKLTALSLEGSLLALDGVVAVLQTIETNVERVNG